MSRAEDALITLYESADLRDSLVDEDANALLKWAEGEIARLDAASPDDMAFETGVEALRRVIKGMNRFVGKWSKMTPDERVVALDQIAGASVDIGRPISVQNAPTLTDNVPVGDQTLRGDPMLFETAPAAFPMSDSEVLDALMVWVNGIADKSTTRLDPSSVLPPMELPAPPSISSDEEFDL